jgi:fido (protein-threonine AMPylation protein)
MRRYAILKVLVQNQSGISPKEISDKTGIALSNCYTYLGRLKNEQLIQNRDGLIFINSGQPKVNLLLDLQAMVPKDFDELISTKFGSFLRVFSKSLIVDSAKIGVGNQYRLKRIAIPNRIVLLISKKPGRYCLKLNELLVKTLLAYHGIAPAFTEVDFNKLVENLSPRQERLYSKTLEASPELVKVCEDYYKEDRDFLLPKVASFVPDGRVAPLLVQADQVNKEYQLFLSSLDENTRKNILSQWEKRYIYNTNSIEGNTMSEEQVAEFLKAGIKPPEVSDREIHETNNLRRAIHFLEIKRAEEISLELMKEIHFQVQSEIREDAGYLKASYNFVKPNFPTTPPQYVKNRLEALVQWYKANKDRFHPLVLASIVHMQFELIHPFSDGNGRVGRLIANHILRQRGYLPFTIPVKTKEEYYRAIQNHSLPQFLLYTTASFIEEYRR